MFGTVLESRVIRDPYWNAWGASADITPTGTLGLEGRTVGTEQALRLLTVYACVKFISESISMLPLEVFRGKGRTREKIVPPPRWIDLPNPEQSRQEFLGQAIASILLTGNFYALVVRDRFGQTVELWPLHPDEVTPRRPVPGAPIVYEVIQPGLTRTIAADDILHVKGGISLAGDIKGRSPISDARMAITTGLALQDFAKAFFDNGATVSGVIETPVNASVDAGKMREQWDAMHRGARKAQGVAVLTGGAHFTPIAINPNDAQFLESRNFTGAEISAGMFGLHPEMIGLTHGIAGGKDITYQNLESRWVELARRALQPIYTRLEFGYSNLLPGVASNGTYTKFNISEYLRPDQLARFQAHQLSLGGPTGAGKAWQNVDEIRDEEDLPPDESLNNPPAPPQAPPPPAPAPDQGQP